MTRLRRLIPPLALVLWTGCHGPAGGAGHAPAVQPEPSVQEGMVDAGAGVQLFYRVVGGAQPDTVIILHGGPGLTLEYLAADLTPLAARHTLLFYDQRGAGRSSLVSDSVGLDAQRFAEDVEAVRRHFGIQRVTLLGHSWGAAVAALYASRYPDRIRRLLIVNGVPLRAEALTQAFQALAAQRDSATRREMAQWMARRRADPGDVAACRAYYVLWFGPFFVDRAALSRSRGDFCAGTAESRGNKIRSVDRYVVASLGSWDWRPALRQLNVPTLIVHGDADPLPVNGAREWAAVMPDARILLFQQIGHFPYLEDPDAFFRAVDTFLRGSWPERAERLNSP